MFGKVPRTNVVSILSVCILVLCFTMAIGAKPRKKSKKQKETVAQKTARLRSDDLSHFLHQELELFDLSGATQPG